VVQLLHPSYTAYLPLSICCDLTAPGRPYITLAHAIGTVLVKMWCWKYVY
jgi:hypothetical protein